MSAPTTDPDRDRTTVEATTGLDRDELFHLLKSERRRRTLRYLLEVDRESVEVEALAAAVADGEGDRPPEADRERVTTTLVHADLPRLDEAGVVDYDPDRGRVTATPLVRLFEPYLGPVPDVLADETTDAPTAGPVKPAIAGFAGGSCATFLLLKVVGVAAVFGLALLVAASTWTVLGR